MKIFHKIDHFIEMLQVWACAILFGAIVVLGTIQVCGRYVFNYSIPWSEETMRFCCIWMVFIGAALTVRSDGHVSIDILQGFLKNNKTKAVLYLIGRLMCVVFLVWIFPASIELINRTKSSMAATLPLSFSFVYASFAVGAVMMLLSYIATLPKTTAAIWKGEKDE
ncbi:MULTISPECIES: TRAP transporter small permease [Anaerotruncus]|jgi:TRAP-type C4-dicarboxylate transport system permease small subunit|uniref:TRAP transporter small permease n=1 Tax=Anaerotruncus TaxID=244127 RepID=UPI00082A7FE2|nr:MULTISPECIES: TRAP transporter small permease [Anaerotruncus]RGX55787.1 TRAP transporter small permease [Anaerotruncus sp. AF02-27]